MKVTIEINDYSNPAEVPIRVHSAWSGLGGKKVEIDVEGARHIVDGNELISAIERCMLDEFGR